MTERTRKTNASQRLTAPQRPDAQTEYPVTSNPEKIVELQRLVGNQGVQRLMRQGYFGDPPTSSAPQPVSGSVGLSLRRQFRQMPHPLLQRAGVNTWAGEWDTAKYEIVKDKGGKEIGVDIDLHFKPGDKVNATQIGTLQMVNSINEGKVVNINPTVKDRSIPDGQPGAGQHIDQAPHNRNPLYAVENPPGTDTGLGDTPANAGFGQHGFRFKDATGNEQKKDATLLDTPKLPDRGNNASQIFETTALAISGTQEGTYYGSVRWGWETDGTGNFKQLPLSVTSNDVPSGTFGAAAKVWNDSKTSKGEDTLDVPIVAGKYTNSPGVWLVSNPSKYKQTHLRNLALNTRVEVTNKGETEPFNQVTDPQYLWHKVTVVDGTGSGMVGWVMQHYLSDDQKVKKGAAAGP